jgi:hypothetical protein
MSRQRSRIAYHSPSLRIPVFLAATLFQEKIVTGTGNGKKEVEVFVSSSSKADAE